MSDLQTRFAKLEATLSLLSNKLDRVSGKVGIDVSDIKLDTPANLEPKDTKPVKPEVKPHEIVPMVQNLFKLAKELESIVIKDAKTLVKVVDSSELHGLLLSVLSLIKQTSKQSIKALMKSRSGCWRFMNNV